MINRAQKYEVDVKETDLTSSPATRRTLSARRSRPLSGRMRAPGDKSISHRAFIFGLLSLGETHISGALEGEDVLRTIAACRALGAEIDHRGQGLWSVKGAGIGSLLPPRGILNFGNAGTGSRLMMGIIGGHPLTARFDGDDSLRKRPMRRILEPLILMGAQALETAEGGRLPLILRGAADPSPIEYRTPTPSAQIKSAVLFAGLNSPGRTVVIETEASRDHTEKMLAHFGASVAIEPYGDFGRRITLEGRPKLTPAPVTVPADPSSAAFPIVAALITPGSDIIVEGVMMNPLRTGLLTTLKEMGGRIDLLDQRTEGGEDVADLRVRASILCGIDVPAARAPSMIDEYPILSIAAACANGDTRMRGLKELRVKESDRLAAVAEGLRANKIRCEIMEDDLLVRGCGGPPPGGGFVITHLDHRIAMSFLVLGGAAQTETTIDDETMIATSFPTFCAQMSRLGAEFSSVGAL